MEQTQTIGKRICAHRKRLGLTQDQLAEKVGVSPQAVSKWENDLSCPDISALPVLAGIFGVTTDELLGVAPQLPPSPPPQEDDTEPEGIHISTDGKHTLDFHIGPPRSGRLAFALWVMAIGGMMLLGAWLGLRVDFWSAVWTTGLTVWGLNSVLHHVSFSGVLFTLAGLYFMADELELLELNMGWHLLFPALVLVFGLCLLLEALTRKGRSRWVHINTPGRASRAYLKDGFLTYTGSFCERSYLAQTDLLRGGTIEVSFGDNRIDLTGVKALAPDCRLTCRASFGDTRILVPKRFRADVTAASGFADIKFRGHCDEDAQQVLHIDGSVSFGDLIVEYV